MVLKPRQKKYSLDVQSILNNEIIEAVKEAVFFGVILDENLNWKSAYISRS